MSRLVDFAGPVFNFRDVGGLTTVDGLVVRPGTLFRSDALGPLREQDRPAFSRLGIRSIIDLRQPVEVERYRRAPQWAAAYWHHVPFTNPVWRPEDYSPAAGVTAFLVERYREIVEQAGADLARAIDIIAAVDSGPTVVHCLGGRDRTGIVIALVLDLLGVGDEQIAADYHLTEQGMARFTAWARIHRPELAELPPYMASTPPEAILTLLDDVRGRHGSVRDYLLASGLAEQRLAQLRDRLLPWT